MADWKFTIIKNKTPQRCEVCHQSDLFNPDTGICQRCQKLEIEKLANPEIYSIYTIPASQTASLVALMLSGLCLLAGFVSLQAFFKMWQLFIYKGYSLIFFSLLVLNLINFPVSLALNRWCSERYNERLEYRVVILGRICSFIGLSGSGLGLICAIPRLLSLLKGYW